MRNTDKGPEGVIFGRENEIEVTGTEICSLEMGNELLKNGNGMEVMQVDF